MRFHCRRLLPLIVFVVAVALGLRAYSGGPPVRRTGAPGDRTCLDAGCHAGDRIPDSNAIRLETPGQLTYVPGGPRQRWTLRINDNLARAFGFQMTARLASDPENTPGGHFHEIDASTHVLCDNDRPSGPAGCAPNALVQFVQHIQPREAGVFGLEWTPPSADAGDVIVYVAANASVAGQRSARIHFRNFRVRPAVTTGVVHGASFRGEISSGAWASAFGTGFSSVSREWRPAEIVNGVLPTSLEGLTVRVNGTPAALAFVSPGQINFQVPDLTGNGQALVEIHRDGRQAAQLRVNHSAIAPGIFVYHDGGRDFAAAVHSDGRAVTSTAPARPGETILIFGSGFGPTNPPVPSGRTFSAAAPAASQIRLRLGGLEANVAFAGLVSPGLFQINAVVPDASAGDQLLEVDAGGHSAQENVYVSIGGSTSP